MRPLILICFIALTGIKSYSQDSFALNLSDAALGLTRDKVKYDPKYYAIDYPNGDIRILALILTNGAEQVQIAILITVGCLI